MKTPYIVKATLGATILAWWIYLWNDDNTAVNQNTLTPNWANIPALVSKNKKDMWEILAEASRYAEANPWINLWSNRSAKDELLEFVEKNQALKMRIQWMSWYRDFLSWKLDFEEWRKNIMDSALIEQAFQENPWMLMKIQYSNIWRQYLSGIIPPHNVIYWEIPAIISLDDFSSKYPDIFDKIKKNPLFQVAENGEETTFSQQKSLIDGILINIKSLQNNPSLQAKFAQYWYWIDDLYTSSWNSQDGIYSIRDAVYNLEDQNSYPPEVWHEFSNSEIWWLYKNGWINPKNAFLYINELILRYAEKPQ